MEAFYTILGLTFARGRSGTIHVVRANENPMFAYILTGSNSHKAQVYSDNIQSMVNDFSNTEIWWHGDMEPWPVNAAFAAAVVHTRYKRTPLEDNVNEFKNEFFIFNIKETYRY